MTLGHPLVDAAVADLRLTAVELRVFRVMWCQLDFEHYREKKSDVLALEVMTDRSYASAALRKLVELGYLEAGDRSERGVQAYRLPRVVPAGGAHSPRSVEPPRMRRQIRNTL
jgi:hypothetical protein